MDYSVTIIEIKSKVDGRTTSWSVRGFRDGKGYKLANCKTKEEALEVQRKFTNNPDTYELSDHVNVHAMVLAMHWVFITKKIKKAGQLI